MSVQTTITRQDPDIEAYRLGLLSDVQGLIRNQMFGQQVQNLRSQGFTDQQIAAQLSTGRGVEGDEDYVEGTIYTAQDIAQVPAGAAFAPPDYQVAGLTPSQITAVNLAKQGVGAYKPYISRAVDSLGAAQRGTVGAGQLGQTSALQGIASLAGSAKQFSPEAISAFMSPYQEDVIDTTLADLERFYDRRRAQEENRLAAEAVARGAFSGEAGRRRAEAQVLNPMREEFERNVASTIAGVRQQGYQDAAARAQQAFEQARARQLQAAQATGSLGQMGAGTGLAAASQLGQTGVQIAGMGELEQTMRNRDINALMTTGGMSQAQAQAVLDAQRMSGVQAYQQPFQQLGFLSDVYAGVPTSQSTQTMTSGSNASPFMQAASLGIAGLSAATGAQNAGIL